MTLFQVEELSSYWARHPPLHLLIAAYLGLGKDRRRPAWPELTAAKKPSGPDVGSVLARLGPGFVFRDVHAGLSPVILDFAELRRAANTAD